MQIKLVLYKVGPLYTELPYLELPAILSEKSFPLDFSYFFQSFTVNIILLSWTPWEPKQFAVSCDLIFFHLV